MLIEAPFGAFLTSNREVLLTSSIDFVNLSKDCGMLFAQSLTLKLEKLNKMKLRRGLFVGVFALCGVMLAYSPNAMADISVEGHYQGKNLFVQSPESEDGFGYCINRVTVNGQPSSTQYQSSAFQIDLTEFNVKVGDAVLVVVEHEEGCQPKLLNPEVLLPKSTFVMEEISCSAEGVLTWRTTGESGKLNYQIEQKKWNKWVVIGEVQGLGSASQNNYSFNVSPHSGENTIRVCQVDNTGEKHISEEVVFTCSSCPEPVMKSTEEGIVFENDGKAVKTKYEIFDAYGNIVKKGMNSVVICTNLKKGVYHVNYDNKYERFIYN